MKRKCGLTNAIKYVATGLIKVLKMQDTTQTPALDLMCANLGLFALQRSGAIKARI